MNTETPSREMNAWIDRHVFGTSTATKQTARGYSFVDELAIEALQRMRRSGWNVSFDMLARDDEPYAVEIYTDGAEISAFAKGKIFSVVMCVAIYRAMSKYERRKGNKT